MKLLATRQPTATPAGRHHESDTAHDAAAGHENQHAHGGGDGIE